MDPVRTVDICFEKLYKDVKSLNIVPIILHKILGLTKISFLLKYAYILNEYFYILSILS